MEKGLCFRCDKKFGPGHRCKSKQLQIQIVNKEAKKNEVGEEEPAVEEAEVEEKLLELSINSFADESLPKTLKLRGKLGGTDVIILLDYGTTHNFISKKLVRELGIPVTGSNKFVVTVGDGRKVKGIGICSAVQFEVQGLKLTQNFFPFEFDNLDMILGVEWLMGLGEVKLNLKAHTMGFSWKWQNIGLQGDPSSATTKSSYKSFLKTVRTEGTGLWMEFAGMVAEVQKDESPGVGRISGILTQFADVFAEPTGLPPHRLHDHSILLQLDSQPPNIRPYRYPQYQKDEIKKIIKEMLLTGIIRPSISPYAIPILLVRRRMGVEVLCRL